MGVARGRSCWGLCDPPGRIDGVTGTQLPLGAAMHCC